MHMRLVLTGSQLSIQYKKFKQVANSKAYEKQLGKRFEDASGYSLYKVMQAAKEKTAGKIRVNQDDK